ncbi:dienelactone hydrolase family protein, partial [Commensalibacter sp. Nvir]|uniref:alpha/beta hydrolase n=1 Tax=Commensalibacter sp. Nvir TaxID=3069817 RepID=UPI0030C89DEF
AAALDWLQMANTNSRELWISGYSFGAFVGMQLLMRRPEIQGWISVAPLANHYDFNFLAPCPCGGLMIAGEKDTVVPIIEINKLVEKLNSQKGIDVDYQILLNANHIFANEAELIEEAIFNHVNKIIKQRKDPSIHA